MCANGNGSRPAFWYLRSCSLTGWARRKSSRGCCCRNRSRAVDCRVGRRNRSKACGADVNIRSDDDGRNSDELRAGRGRLWSCRGGADARGYRRRFCLSVRCLRDDGGG